MIPLFVLRNIAAVNFYLYAQDFPFEGPGSAVFLGANSSGKSVLLDAIQTVMTGMNRRYLDLNSRVSEGGKTTRTVREACLGLLDDGAGYEREACLTYIALGFEAQDGSSRCTAGVCLEAKASLNEENVLGLFIAEGAILRFQDFVSPRGEGFQEKPWQGFLDEQRRKGQTIQTFQRQSNRVFLRHLYSLINANERGTQLDPDRARAAMRQALSFNIDQIKSVTDFVKKFLLDEIPIEIDTFQARYTTWREMQKQIVRVEAEIKTVEAIQALAERVMDDQFNARFWTYGAYRAEYDRYSAVIRRQQHEILKMQGDLDGARAYQKTIEEDTEKVLSRLEAVNGQIKGIPAFDQIKEAQIESGRQDAIRKTANIEAKPIFDALSGLREAGLNSLFPAKVFPAVTELARKRLIVGVIGVYDSAWPASPSQIASVIEALPSLVEVQSHVKGLYEGAAAEAARLSQGLKETDRLLGTLRDGGTYMSEDTRAFLADMKRMGVPAQSLSEVADIATAFAEWRGIVEAILGDWVDAVIVEPQFMNRAYPHFDANYKGTQAKLIQSENVSALDLGTRSGTLAEAVITENRFARAFLNVRLGRIVRARSANDIRKGDLAASADGKYAHGRGIEYRRLRPIPRLGKSVRDQQIAQLTEQRSSLLPLVDAAKENEIRLLAIEGALSRAEIVLISKKQESLGTLEKIEAADVKNTRLRELVADLESELPHGAMQQRRELEQELVELKEGKRKTREKEDRLIGDIGSRTGAMGINADERKKAAKLAIDAFPDFEMRVRRHNTVVGLEWFVRRVHSAYQKERAAQHEPALLRIYFDKLLKDKRLSQRSAVSRLTSAVHDYVLNNPDQHPGFEWTMSIEREETSVLFDWISLRHRDLKETVLRNFKEQVDKAVLALVETMVHDFLSRLRANIDTVERTKDDLNHALRGRVFMGEVYQIRQERDHDKATLRYLIDRLDIVAPKATALMRSAPDPNDPDQAKIKELIDMLTFEAKDDSEPRRRLRELADYRNYFRFSIDICNTEYRKISDLEQRRGKASGGQKFVPFYICLGVAAASAFHNHLGGSKDAPPQSGLLLMDEAFEKLDPENIYKIIQFYKSLGLQLIMAAPKTHQALYQETFDTLISIIRVGRAIRATAQHFHAPAHELLHNENPMHKPRSFFEERVLWEGKHAAE